MTRLFVEGLTVIDCGVLDRVRGLVGTSWLVDAELAGAVDDTGMILDFGPAKRLIKERIDAVADHRLLVPADAPGLAWEGDCGTLHFTDDAGGRIHHRGPGEAVCAVPSETVSADAAARLLERDVAAWLPANVSGISLTLREEAIAGASYNYCHGLKRHGGNCQRIAHGHRSRLEIRVDGERSSEHEQHWCRRWRNVFLGNRADLVSDPAEPRYRFAYQAEGGAFELELDAERCELLDSDTTVENIAGFIARQLKREQPECRFEVRAYEGVNKGAVASA